MSRATHLRPPLPGPASDATARPVVGSPPRSGRGAHGAPEGLPACAVVDLTAIRDNVAVLRERAGDAAVMAVVKADGYGHGLVPSARAALAGGAAWLGVAQLAEALLLRDAGITAPLLSWLTVPGDAYARAVAADVDLGVSAPWALEEAAAAARATGRPARVHLKIDTGLHRNGCMPQVLPELADAVLKLQAEGTVHLVGVFSHFAWADEPSHPTIRHQTRVFTEAVDLLESRGAHPEVRHIANSAAALTDPGTRFDMVRPGLAVYGLSPVPQLAHPQAYGLRPAMTLVGRIAAVKPVEVGAGVSYGHTYVTQAPTTLAVVPLGYADGVPRHASDAGPVQVRGRTYQVVGRVCMDQIVIDLHDPRNGAGVREGDVAVLFGDGADGGPTAQDWAEAAGTISYEVVCRIGSRVARRWIGLPGAEVP